MTSHGEAVVADNEAMEQCRSVLALAVRERSLLEEISDACRRNQSHLQDTRTALDQLKDALERTHLVVIQAGLEGARLGDAAGKAVVVMTDDLRSLNQRGLDVLTEGQNLLEVLRSGDAKLAETVDRTREQHHQVLTELQEAQSSLGRSLQALNELGRLMEQATGLNPEHARALKKVTEHAQGIMEALIPLESSEQKAWARASLLPCLEPLLCWLNGETNPNPEHSEKG